MDYYEDYSYGNEEEEGLYWDYGYDQQAVDSQAIDWKQPHNSYLGNFHMPSYYDQEKQMEQEAAVAEAEAETGQDWIKYSAPYYCVEEEYEDLENWRGIGLPQEEGKQRPQPQMPWYNDCLPELNQPKQNMPWQKQPHRSRPWMNMPTPAPEKKKKGETVPSMQLPEIDLPEEMDMFAGDSTDFLWVQNQDDCRQEWGLQKADMEGMEERDMQYMKQLYSSISKRIMPSIDRVLSQHMSHHSPIYEEFPDREAIRQLIDEVVERAKIDIAEVEEIFLMSEKADDQTNWNWSQNQMLYHLVEALVLHEVFGCKRPRQRKLSKEYMSFYQ